MAASPRETDSPLEGSAFKPAVPCLIDDFRHSPFSPLRRFPFGRKDRLVFARGSDGLNPLPSTIELDPPSVPATMHKPRGSKNSPANGRNWRYPAISSVWVSPALVYREAGRAVLTGNSGRGSRASGGSVAMMTTVKLPLSRAYPCESGWARNEPAVGRSLCRGMMGFIESAAAGAPAYVSTFRRDFAADPR